MNLPYFVRKSVRPGTFFPSTSETGSRPFNAGEGVAEKADVAASTIHRTIVFMVASLSDPRCPNASEQRLLQTKIGLFQPWASPPLSPHPAAGAKAASVLTGRHLYRAEKRAPHRLWRAEPALLRHLVDAARGLAELPACRFNSLVFHIPRRRHAHFLQKH